MFGKHRVSGLMIRTCQHCGGLEHLCPNCKDEISKLESNDQFILNLSIKELLKIDTSKLSRRQYRIRTLLLVYAKCHLDHEDIGWNELDGIIADDLMNTIGDKPYQAWMKRREIENL